MVNKATTLVGFIFAILFIKLLRWSREYPTTPEEECVIEAANFAHISEYEVFRYGCIRWQKEGLKKDFKDYVLHGDVPFHVLDGARDILRRQIA